ncbi:MAG: hypothetical protein AVDCRST_MAG67-1807, partial [uncultured Solirubrobacteraceae bacterium]
ADRIWYPRVRDRRFARDRARRRPRACTARRSGRARGALDAASRGARRRAAGSAPPADLRRRAAGVDHDRRGGLRRGHRRPRPARRQRRDRALPAGRRAEPRAHREHDGRQLVGHRAHGAGRAAVHARPGQRPHRRHVLRRGAARLSRRRCLQRDEGGAADVRRGAASRARRQRRLGDDRLPRRDPHLAARPRAHAAARVVPRRPRGGVARGACATHPQGRRARQPPPALPPVRQGHGHRARAVAGPGRPDPAAAARRHRGTTAQL